MRIAEINMMHTGSTGKIMFGIAEVCTSCGHEVHTFSPNYYSRKRISTVPIANHSYFGFEKENALHYITGELTGLHGYGSYFGTKQLIRALKAFKPDIVHLHNLHNFSFNIPALFTYLKKEKIRTVWTLHDCWALTGKCPHFTMAGCGKWKTGCYSCPVLGEYPKAYADRVRKMWRMKRKWFTGFDRMTIVTPSRWLAEIVRSSFLSEYPVRVIHNGIDPEVFKPCPDAVPAVPGIDQKKHIVLGVAFDWGRKKGLDVFIELSERLPEAYQIVLVGTNEITDQMLPSSIISIHRTQNQDELAALYSVADVFVNPTREDNFPTVNLEALACGTPVITFQTGGSPETIDETCGIVVNCNDTDQMREEIIKVCEQKTIKRQDCIRRASLYRASDKYREYVSLYEELCV